MKRKRLVALAMLLALLVSMLNPAAGARASAASVANVTVIENYIDDEGLHIIGGGFYQPAYGEKYSYTAPSTKYYNGRAYDFFDISAPAPGLSRTHNGVYTDSVEFSSVVITVTYLVC